MGLNERHAIRMDIAAGATGSRYLYPPNGETWLVKSLAYGPHADVSADDTNNATLRAYKGAGTSTPIAAARQTDVAGGAFTGGTVEAITLTGTGADLEITEDDPLQLEKAEAGSGAAIVVDLVVEFERLRT